MGDEDDECQIQDKGRSAQEWRLKSSMGVKGVFEA
jgi:hypothetical protein